MYTHYEQQKQQWAWIKTNKRIVKTPVIALPAANKMREAEEMHVEQEQANENDAKHTHTRDTSA